MTVCVFSFVSLKLLPAFTRWGVSAASVELKAGAIKVSTAMRSLGSDSLIFDVKFKHLFAVV